MKKLLLVNVLIVAALLSGCGKDRVKSTPNPPKVLCPSSAFIDAHVTKGPESGQYELFKLWAAKTAVNEGLTVSAYKDLLACWVRYHGEVTLQTLPELPNDQPAESTSESPDQNK